MNIKIIGTGYVGLITGLCLSLKHQVECVDINTKIVEKINLGLPHLYEEGLEELLKKQLNSGNFKSILLKNLSLKGTDIVLICVGTPSLEDDSCDLNYVNSAIESIIPLLSTLKQNISIIIKSTVPPGTVSSFITKKVRETYPLKSFPNIAFGMNPEFLREGSAISDFLNPDRIVLGADSEISQDHLIKLYKHFECPKIIVNSSTAEMIKYVNNSLLALQISAVNEYSRVCESIDDVDIRKVMSGVLQDKRWQSNKNPKIPPGIHNYLKGFGGSCFPKDVKALSKFASLHKVNTPLLDGTLSINENQPALIVKKVSKITDLNKAKVLLLGVSFKPNTDDIRDSPTHLFIKHFASEGSKIYVHDPLVLDKLKSHPSSRYLENTSYLKNFKEVLQTVEIVILISYWACYLELPSLITKKNQVIFDSRGFFNSNDFPLSQYFTTGLK